MDEFITACPRNCYSTCTFRVQVENGRIRRILPYDGNKATPEGPCIKGLSYLERANSPDRIIYPLVRTTDGSFEKAPLKETLDLISNRLAGLSDRYGPQSILWYKGSGMSGLTNDSGYSFWKAFGGATLTYGNLCWPAGLEAVRLTLGSIKHNVPWDLQNAKTILIWGKNPAETNIQEISFIAAAKNKGSNIIVIDPVRTTTADKADILYSIKPGSDGALALAMAKVLIDNDLIDRKFIENNVRGFEEFRKSLQISTDDAESLTGIPSREIVQLAKLIGTEGPVTFLPGYGLQRHANGGQTIRSILSLAIITGNLGKSGAGFNYANLQSYVFDDVREPLSYYPDPEKDSPFRRSVSMAKLGSDMLNQKTPELKAAFIERGNPILQSPDSNLIRKAFTKLEFKVVIEEFMTDTAALADVILPAKNMFEQSDIIGSYWSPYVQFKPKIIDPQGDVKPESEIYYELACRLKLDLPLGLIPEPGNVNIEKWLESRIKGYTYLHLDDLRQGPVLAPGLQEIAYYDMRFDTPSGKIELFSEEASARWNVSALPEYIPVHDPDIKDHYPLVFLTPNTGSRIHSQFGNLNVIKENEEEPALLISHSDAEKRKIFTGNMIRVFNRFGELSCRARVTNRIPSGSVLLPNGIWLKEGGGGNHLIEGRETDMGYGAAFHDNMVEVEKTEME